MSKRTAVADGADPTLKDTAYTGIFKLEGGRP
jgi:hypothetical protein